MWITCCALAAPAILEDKISRASDDETPSRLSQIIELVTLIGVAVLFTSHTATTAKTEASDQKKVAPQRADTTTDASVNEPRTVPLAESETESISINQLRNEDYTYISGVSCWAFNNQDNVLFASDGIAVIRINGNLIKLTENNGRIGGNMIHSAEDDITVTFRERPGKKFYFEEDVSTSMTMTILNGRAETSVPVMRSCGA